MGRAKAIEEADLQEVLSLRDDFGVLQKDSAQMQNQVSKLQEEVQLISSKQGDISVQVGTVEKVVLDLSKQLSTISSVLQTLVKPLQNQVQPDNPSSSNQVDRSPTLRQEQRHEQVDRVEQLRQQLAAEKEKSKQLEDLQLHNLPPIRTNRANAPPGYTNQVRQDTNSVIGTPRNNAHTPAFNQFYQNRDRQLWQGYHKTYEQDMQVQFMKSITKGPKLDFPRFSGEDPVGWIRQCNKFFQMSAAPEEYKVSLAQMYIIDEADTWLRRSGLLQKQLTWKQFGAEVVKRFSEQGSYDLTEKFNTLKRLNNTVSEYTKNFEDLMAEIQEENPALGELWFVRCYVNGLRDGIKFQIRPLRPQTLTDAYCLAKDVEPCHPPLLPSVKKQGFSYTNYYQKQQVNVQTKPTTSTP